PSLGRPPSAGEAGTPRWALGVRAPRSSRGATVAAPARARESLRRTRSVENVGRKSDSTLDDAMDRVPFEVEGSCPFLRRGERRALRAQQDDAPAGTRRVLGRDRLARHEP